MIQFQNKQDCCGCNACVQICPKRCIKMYEDEEGFLYPQVNGNLCIDCHLCEKVCPVLNQNEPRQPLHVYAAKNPDEEIRRQSSSGGVFTMLAEQVINEGGVVFGAKFNESWEVVHDYTETKEGLSAFRGSKYVQSRIGETFKQTETFLKQGRKVLFSGTPCQISGLKKFLQKEYENLLTVDFICHGTPGPGVWRKYLKEEVARQCEKNTVSLSSICGGDTRITSIYFRDKKLGWKKYSFALNFSVADCHGKQNSVSLSEPLNKNHFLRGFLADLYLRPSCHVCPAKELKSGSDITLGDWWGIQNEMPEYDDDKGVSAICVNTEKGQQIFQQVHPDLKDSTFQTIVQYNSALVHSPGCPDKRKAFYNEDGKNFFEKIDELCHLSLSLRIRNKVSTIIRKLIGTKSEDSRCIIRH